MVFPIADDGKGFCGGEAFIIAAAFTGGLFENSLLVGFVRHGEAADKAEFGNVFAQNTDAETVEGAERYCLCHFFVDQLSETFPHLPCRFVGKGQSEDLFRQNAVGDHAGDSKCDDPGFAGSGTGEDQNRSLMSSGGFSLRRVEGIQNCLTGQLHISTKNPLFVFC